MAYSLNDAYRHLRLVMRVDGLIAGLGLGFLLALAPPGALAGWGILASEPLWPLRLAGGLLITLGVMLMLAAQERIVAGPIMLAMSLGNSVTALVLISAYLQQDLATLTLAGRIVLIIVFALCLLGALFPLPYIRAEYRAP